MTKKTSRSTVTTKNEDGSETTNESEQEFLTGFERLVSLSPIVAIVGVFITALLGLGGYFSQINTAVREAQKPFLESQLKLYTDTTSVVGDIVSAGRATDDNKKKLLSLYWAQLGLVEDILVDHAMVKFKEFVDQNKPQSCLQAASLLLAHCMRESLRTDWKIPLNDIAEFPCNEQSFDDISNRQCK